MTNTYPVPPTFQRAEALGRYHWDIDQPNDPDVIFKPKFRGDWQAELDLFQPMDMTVDLSNPQTQIQWEEWLRLGYDAKSWSRKMAVDATVMPRIHQCFSHMAWDTAHTSQCWLTEQKPMQHLPLHMDYLTSVGLDRAIVEQRGWRILVFLSDWWPGEFMVWGTETFSHWRAGWVLAFPACKYPHGTANVSYHSGFRLRTAGLMTPALQEWLASDSITEIN